MSNTSTGVRERGRGSGAGNTIQKKTGEGVYFVQALLLDWNETSQHMKGGRNKQMMRKILEKHYLYRNLLPLCHFRSIKAVFLSGDLV